MKYLLDTNICIALINGKEPALRKKLQSLTKTDIALCSVVKAELLYGVKKSARRSENENRLAIFTSEFQSLPFNDECAEHYGNLRTLLEQAGTPIGANDLMIAAIAQTHKLKLITRNTREFEMIPSLQMEAW